MLRPAYVPRGYVRPTAEHFGFGIAEELMTATRDDE